jgi:hypothetical protein
VELVECHPPCHGLCRGFEELRGSASKQQKLGGVVWAIRQHPQQREQIGTQLHLVDHDQSSELPEHKARIPKPSLIVWIFQIEVVSRSLPLFGELPGEGGFADLPCPQHRHHREVGELRVQGEKMARACNNTLTFPEISELPSGFITFQNAT